jgi:hypothetical protein
MIITIEQLKQIVAAGGGLVLDAAVMTFGQLKDISTLAHTSDAKITIKNLSTLTAEQLKELAEIAPGLVVFDQTS